MGDTWLRFDRNDWVNSHCSAAKANAIVARARKKPLSRRAGRPMSRAKGTATSPQQGMTIQNGRWALDERMAAVQAPTPAKARGHKLSWPVQPMSTTRETAISP